MGGRDRAYRGAGETFVGVDDVCRDDQTGDGDRNLVCDAAGILSDLESLRRTL
jgi:hypothetical protein